MYDSTDVAAIPVDAEMAAGYTGGRWPTYADGSLRARCPRALLVSIAVTAADDEADVLDVEWGDATPDEVPGWCRRRRARGKVPSVYASDSTWLQVVDACRRAVVDLPLWWEARPDGRPTLTPGSVAKQYLWQRSPPLDTSVVADYWPGVDPDPRTGVDDMSIFVTQDGRVHIERASPAGDLLYFTAPAGGHFTVIDVTDQLLSDNPGSTPYKVAP